MSSIQQYKDLVKRKNKEIRALKASNAINTKTIGELLNKLQKEYERYDVLAKDFVLLKRTNTPWKIIIRWIKKQFKKQP